MMACTPTTLACWYGCVQVVYGHLDDPEGQEIKRGVSYLNLRPGVLPQATGRRGGGVHGILSNAGCMGTARLSQLGRTTLC